MNCSEIIREIEKIFPPSSAEEWDNPGLLAGRRDREVTRMLVALDASDTVIDEAVRWGAQLLITHHPMIFSPLKKVNDDSFTGERVIRLIENGISCYAMHTNYDVCGMADLNARQLELTDVRILALTGEEEGIGRVGRLKNPMKLSDLARKVRSVFELDDVRVYAQADPVVSTAAVCGGSGKSLLPDALSSGADVFITGDIDYHTGLDAAAQGIILIDAGHFGTEHRFMDDCTERFTRMFPEVEIKKAAQPKPYKLITD